MATREQSARLHAVMIGSAQNLKVWGVVRALRYVRIVDLSMSHHSGRDEGGMPTQLLCLDWAAVVSDAYRHANLILRDMTCCQTYYCIPNH